MVIKKILWVLKGVIYKGFFKKFGALSYIGKPLILHGMSKVSIGDKVRIQPGLRMEVYTDNGSIDIGNNTSIGQNLHIISASKLIIGKNTTVSGNVFITNLEHDYKEIDLHILDQKSIIKETFIGENCFIGYGAVIQAGTVLGKQCIVGSNSVVKGEFPDYCVIAGVPARIIKRYNFETRQWERVY